MRAIDWTGSACSTAVGAGASPEDWFPIDDEARDRAKAVCLDCPVKALCKSYAKAEGLVGVWGGVQIRWKTRKNAALSGAAAEAAARVVCKSGHPYDKITSRGYRKCSECHRISDRSRRRDVVAVGVNAPEVLHRRATAIAALADAGKTWEEIAVQLGITTRTVARYRARQRQQRLEAAA